MYSEELEKFINLALADGVLTDKKKEILFRKADEAGIDRDEFEMVIEGKLFEKQQSIKAAAPPAPVAAAPTAPTSNKVGDVRKCPACGAIADVSSARCTDCGHNFSNVEANSSIQKLFEMLDKVESTRKEEADEKEKSFSSSMGELFSGGAAMKMMSRTSLGDNTDKRKKEIIKNFPIPTTKDDMLEFLALAVPNAKKQKIGMFDANPTPKKIHNEFAIVWHAKCEQIIMKAKFSMKDDKKTLEEIGEYAKELDIKFK